MDWKKHFRQGNISLFDAVFFHLQETGAPHDLIESYLAALHNYQDGKFSDLAEPFGVSMTQREKGKIKTAQRDRQVCETVDELNRGWTTAIVERNEETGAMEVISTRHSDKKAKVDPALYDTENNAYAEAGKMFYLSGSTVFEISSVRLAFCNPRT